MDGRCEGCGGVESGGVDSTCEDCGGVECGGVNCVCEGCEGVDCCVKSGFLIEPDDGLDVTLGMRGVTVSCEESGESGLK